MTNHASAQRIWQATLGRLQLALPRPSFDTWLRDTEGLSLADQTLVVGVPTTFAAAWLEQRMHGLIEDTVSAITRGPMNVTFQVRGATAVAPDAVASTAPAVERVPADPPAPYKAFTPLNPRYSFESFVVGGANQLAYAAAMAAADAPGRSYNPLFIYGGVGLGKTHLLHAVGQRAAANGHTAAYVTTEQFTNEYLAAIRERRTEEFRDRYRSVDLLLLDDIQFISGKEGTQEGFFHTFNALRDAGRQVIVTCDRPPSALPLLEERLRSRLEWGLMADINPPDLETRIAILQRLAATSPVPVPGEVIVFIAERVTSNVRNLEGGFNRVTALAHFTQQPVTIQLAIAALGAVAAQQAGKSSPKAAIDAVASYFKIHSSALFSTKRDRETSTARQAAIYLLHHVLHLRPDEIGRTLGGRDRTTILYALKQVAKRMKTDPEFAAAIEQLSASLGSQQESLP